MKIHSNFYDYYDYCQYDNDVPLDIVFRRVDDTFPEKDGKARFLYVKKNNGFKVCEDYQMTIGKFVHTGVIVICGRPFYLGEDDKILPYYTCFEDSTNNVNPKIHDITAALKVPVLLFTNTFSSHGGGPIVHHFHPCLKEFGLDKIVPPEKMYFEIETYLRTVAHPNPDLMPPVSMSDKEKIVSHGFDNKQSFRHRK